MLGAPKLLLRLRGQASEKLQLPEAAIGALQDKLSTDNGYMDHFVRAACGEALGKADLSTHDMLMFFVVHFHIKSKVNTVFVWS